MQNDDSETLYDCFDRTWWKKATRPGWPNDREPCLGERNYRGHPQGVTESEAREHCEKWNAEHEEGLYSHRAEFERA